MNHHDERHAFDSLGAIVAAMVIVGVVFAVVLLV